MTTRENGRGDSEGLALQPEREDREPQAQATQPPRVAERPARATHVSPDPMSRTDRYRLVTPYWDRV